MPAKPAPAAEVRQRVMLGMIKAVEQHGYANTTIGDIAKAAKISRRTLYEHFPDKQACFLAAYAMLSEGMMSAVVAAARGVPPGRERINTAVSAYFEMLAANPEVARSFLTEIKAAGPEGLELYTHVVQRFATMFVDLIGESEAALALSPNPDIPDRRPFDQTHGLALAGAVNELVLQSVVGGPPETLSVRLERLAGPVSEVVGRLIFIDPAGPSAERRGSQPDRRASEDA